MENEETSILNTDKEPVSPNPLVKDFLPGGMTDWARQIMDSHWFLFNESPTNISLLFLIFSSSSFGLNLPKNTVMTNKKRTQRIYVKKKKMNGVWLITWAENNLWAAISSSGTKNLAFHFLNKWPAP